MNEEQEKLRKRLGREVRIDSWGEELFFSKITDIEDGIQRLTDTNVDINGKPRDRLPIMALLDMLEFEYEKVFRRVYTKYSDSDDVPIVHEFEYRRMEDQIDEEIAAPIAMPYLIEKVRDSVRKDDCNRTALQMMLLTSCLIQSTVRAYAHSGVRQHNIMKRAGQKSGAMRHADLATRNLKILEAANELESSGMAKHKLSGVLSDRFSLSQNRIREILREARKKTDDQLC